MCLHDIIHYALISMFIFVFNNADLQLNTIATDSSGM